MKCHECHATLLCGCCGAGVLSFEERWRARMLRERRCPKCGKPKKRRRDFLGVNCFACRQGNAQRMRARHAKYGRKDRGGKAAGLITYPRPSEVAALPVLFLE